ncbi:hypothetical protein ACPV3A_16345 [Paenibacillus sp. Dod16]|uniref:hypothetical protein n=1 Tax=Paenibacillus sp. Dod16 TaxID=3416392 RepID=UPI003CED0D2B
MQLWFEIYVVTIGKSKNNILVTTVFNDAFGAYMMSKDPDKCIEVWDEGKCIATYYTLGDFIAAGRVVKG